MLVAWLCVACAGAAAEWLQISQQHFRKPLRGGNKNPTGDIFRHTATTPTRTVYLNQQAPTRERYLNQSVSEHDWNQNLRPNRRGDAANSWTEPPTPDGRRDVKITNEQDEGKLFEEKDRVEESERFKDETVSGKVERVTNIGSVKRVQLANTPVKSPAVKVNPESNVDRKHDKGHRTPSNSHFTNVATNIFKESYQDKDLAKHDKHILGIIDEVLSASNRTTTTVSKDVFQGPAPNFQLHSFIHQPDIDSQKVVEVRKGESIYKQNLVSEKKPFINTEADIERKKRPVRVEDLTNNNDVNVPVIKKVSIDTATEDTRFIAAKKKNNIDDKENQNANRETAAFEKIHEDKEKKERNTANGDSDTSSKEIKVNTMENIMKFLKVVTETISRNTRRGANAKVAYLNELKHTLLKNIEERIDMLFPDDEAAGAAARRVSRAARAAAQARGHVQVPSSESALMTISFLTFAVFLIKLVLQVIQTYKHKSMVMAPLMVATAGRAASAASAATAAAGPLRASD